MSLHVRNIACNIVTLHVTLHVTLTLPMQFFCFFCFFSVMEHFFARQEVWKFKKGFDQQEDDWMGKAFKKV